MEILTQIMVAFTRLSFLFKSVIEVSVITDI